MRKEYFIKLSGEGDTKEECWNDAVQAFALEPGKPVENHVTICLQQGYATHDGIATGLTVTVKDFDRNDEHVCMNN
jgi:hypothetical protein